MSVREVGDGDYGKTKDRTDLKHRFPPRALNFNMKTVSFEWSDTSYMLSDSNGLFY